MTAHQQAARRLVRQYLLNHDKTQGWLAKQLKVSESTISSLLRGHHEPSLTLATRLYELTGVKPNLFARSRTAKG